MMGNREAEVAGVAATAMRQVIRYGVVGLGTNAAVYAMYLLITAQGMLPRHAIAVSYAMGASIGFLANRHWTFAHRDRVLPTLLRYLVAHGMGFGLNLGMMWLFHERLGLRHEWVQAVAIVVVAAFLFIMFRYFVFPSPSPLACKRGCR